MLGTYFSALSAHHSFHQNLIKNTLRTEPMKTSPSVENWKMELELEMGWFC